MDELRFYVPSTVFQSFRDDGRMKMKGSVQCSTGFAFGIKGCSSKTCSISSIFRLLCIALWHYVREHIIYTVYSDCVLVFAFAFLSCKKKKFALNRTSSTESYRKWRNSINILKNNGLILKKKQKF